MATCKECFHCAACDMIYESCTGKNVSDLEFPNDAELCEYFKDRTKYVEVVRCKDCVKAVRHEVFPWSRRCRVEDCKFSHKETHFCSYGERKDNERKAD